jgi:hypothetical protein
MPFVVVYDANALYPNVQRDLLTWIATGKRASPDAVICAGRATKDQRASARVTPAQGR